MPLRVPIDILDMEIDMRVIGSLEWPMQIAREGGNV
jgi:hypothetical protein